MRLLVCGSRDWWCSRTVWKHISLLAPIATLLHGAARGADSLAAQAIIDGAGGPDVDVCSFPADWKRDGRAAGPIRNARMLAEGKPDRGLAFGDLWRSTVAPRRGNGGVIRDEQTGWKHTGTGDMVAKLLRARVPVRWVRAPGATAVDLAEMPGPPG